MSGPRLAAALLVVAAIGAVLWWHRERPTATTSAVSPAPPPAPPSPAPSAPTPPAVRYPVPPSSPQRRGLPSLADSDEYLKRTLIDLLGRKAVLSFLHLDGFVRRFVATVNNLGTDSASAQLWPVNQTAGRLDTEILGGDVVISAKNADRYAPFVRFAEGLDTERVVSVYERLYPLFQAAYEDLGYPGKYFNDRVIEVIDDLLATPTMPGAIKVRQIRADGAVSPTGGLFLFEDPSLEARSAGQKILLRMGSENALELEAKLKDVRRRLTTAHPARQDL